MADHGAIATASFSDCGFPSTVGGATWPQWPVDNQSAPVESKARANDRDRLAIGQVARAPR